MEELILVDMFVKRSFSPFLKTGDTFATFSLSGKIFVLNDKNKKVI